MCFLTNPLGDQGAFNDWRVYPFYFQILTPQCQFWSPACDFGSPVILFRILILKWSKHFPKYYVSQNIKLVHIFKENIFKISNKRFLKDTHTNFLLRCQITRRFLQIQCDLLINNKQFMDEENVTHLILEFFHKLKSATILKTKHFVISIFYFKIVSAK